ncbi:MAG: hypothetical protein CMG62_00775 [Candidatus Marinimicrobia bacterium]|nr:hypothetical protein [Candidatus Neomarinimicrobiota bacterium]
MKYILFIMFVVTVARAELIHGIVYDIDTNKPIENVNIFLPDMDIGTLTAKNGSFKFNSINSDTCLVHASMIGYKLFSENFIIGNKENKTLKIFLNKEPIEWKAVNVMGLIPSKHSPEITQMVEADKKINTNQNTLSSFLNNLYGIQVQTAHDYGRNVNISIRGSSDFKPGGYNNRVLLLLDGFPVSIPNSGSSDWNAIPFETVQRIEIVRGPASSIYGHNSMGGVINIVTRSGGDAEKKWYPKLRFGSYGSKGLSLSYSGKSQDTNINSSVGYSSSEGHRFNSGFEQTRLSFKINKILPKNQKIQFSIIGSNSFNQQPGFVYPDNPELISYRESFRISGYLQMYYKRNIGRNIFSISLATNQFKTDYRDRNDTPLEKQQSKTNYRDHSYIIRSQIQRFFNDVGTLVIGTELSFDQSKSNVLRNIYDRPEQITVAGFLQFRKPLSQKFLYDLGLRYDLRNVSGGDGYPVKAFKAFSPKFTFYYKPNSFFTSHFSFNKGFRAPSISELFLEYESSYGLLLKGNPYLRSESLTSTEIGLKYQKQKDLSFFGNIYLNQYRDMIDFIYTIPVKSINRDEVRGAGIEMGSDTYLKKTGSNINLSYSYLKMENIDSDIPLLYRPSHRFKLTFLQELPFLTFQFSSKYTSSQLYEDFLNDDHPIIDNKVIFPLMELPETIITDLNISKKVMNYDLSVKIKNITDKKYVLIQHYPMPGRNFEISINKIID